MVDNHELFKKVLIKNTSLVTGALAGVHTGVIWVKYVKYIKI